MSKRETLARALSATRLFKMTGLLSSGRLTVFNYHRIAATGIDPSTEAFDSSVFGPDQENFRKELQWMKNQADPVSENDLIGALNKRNPLPKRTFMVTFDDGYRDCHERALPILKELGIPAVFFIPTEAIEERKLGWWDLISWFLKRTKKKSISLRGELYALGGSIDRSAERLRQIMKLEAATHTGTLMVELSEACEVAEPDFELRDRELMTWQQIRDCDKSGITIGSHTHSHRVLASLDLESQREELIRSKKVLEERLGKPVRSIAYPVGGYEHFNIETKALAREVGYEVAYSFLTGVNLTRAMDPFDIKRICPPISPAQSAGIFCLPRIFALPLCAQKEPASITSAD